MPKFDKPDSPNIIWGVNALDADLTRPDDSYIQTGWTQVKPPYEYENYSMNKLYQGFAYYNQLGFPEWDSVTEYQSGKSYVQGSNNRVYKCVQTHSNKNPATAGNESWWELFEGNRQATTASRGTVELATDTEAFEKTSTSHVITPSNLFSILPSVIKGDNGELVLETSDSGTKKDLIVKWGRVPAPTTQTPTVSFSGTSFTQRPFIVIPYELSITADPSENYGIAWRPDLTSKDTARFWVSSVSIGIFGFLAIGY